MTMAQATMGLLCNNGTGKYPLRVTFGQGLDVSLSVLFLAVTHRPARPADGRKNGSTGRRVSHCGPERPEPSPPLLDARAAPTSLPIPVNAGARGRMGQVPPDEVSFFFLFARGTRGPPSPLSSSLRFS